MTLPVSKNRVRMAAIALLLAACVIGAMMVETAKSFTPRGASVPWTTLEAENAVTNGTIVSTNQLGMEASGGTHAG